MGSQSITTRSLRARSRAYFSVDSTVVLVSGKLSVAGARKTVSMYVSLVRGEGAAVRALGTTELLMTDFGVEPPSMMFGVLKTDDKIVINFNLSLTAQ